MFTKNRILFLVGLIIVFIPLSGFPYDYRNFFIIVSGLLVVVIAYLLSKEKRLKNHIHDKISENKVADQVFVESQPSVLPKPLAEENFTDLKEIKDHSHSLKS